MKKTKMLKAGLLTMGLAMATTAMVGGTMASYITTNTSADSARVAVWGINAGEQVLDLFDESYENGKSTVVNSQDGDNLIAPGTTKTAKFAIVNHINNDLKPEVKYELRIDASKSTADAAILANENIRFKLDDGEWGTFEALITQIESLAKKKSGTKDSGTEDSKANIYEAGEINENFTKEASHTIAWKWDFTNGNEVDTKMGNAAVDGDLNIEIVVDITAEQVAE